MAVNAQEKTSSIGIRMGGLSGISYKYMDNDYLGFELIAGGKDQGLQLTGLLQKYQPIAAHKLAGLFVFVGGGAHAGYSKYTEDYVMVIEGNNYYSYYEKTSPVLGGDFIIGTAYHFDSIPLHLSLDYKPYFEVFGEKTFRLDLWDIGFTIRYSFNG